MAINQRGELLVVHLAEMERVALAFAMEGFDIRRCDQNRAAWPDGTLHPLQETVGIVHMLDYLEGDGDVELVHGVQIPDIVLPEFDVPSAVVCLTIDHSVGILIYPDHLPCSLGEKMAAVPGTTPDVEYSFIGDELLRVLIRKLVTRKDNAHLASRRGDHPLTSINEPRTGRIIHIGK